MILCMRAPTRHCLGDLRGNSKVVSPYQLFETGIATGYHKGRRNGFSCAVCAPTSFLKKKSVCIVSGIPEVVFLLTRDAHGGLGVCGVLCRRFMHCSESGRRSSNLCFASLQDKKKKEKKNACSFI